MRSKTKFTKKTYKNKRTKKNKTKLSQKTKRNKPKKMKGGRKKQNINLLLSQKLFFTPNEDENYKPIGLVHVTQAGAISALRDKVSDFFNYFGKTGYETSVYDVCRHGALKKLFHVLKKRGGDTKICNIILDIDSADKDVFAHAHGTLYTRK